MSKHVTAALQRRALAASKVTDIPLTSWKGDLEFAKLVNTTISECTELTSHLHNVQLGNRILVLIPAGTGVPK